LGGQEFDYETQNTFQLVVTARDYLQSADVTFTLNIHVTDINEPPYFTGSPVPFTVNESMVGVVCIFCA